MKPEEKQLLFKVLCAGLPYGVKCNALLKQVDGSLKSVFGVFKGYNGWATVGDNLVDIETVKPYLRPMSSMTKEEDKEWQLYKNSIACSCDEILNERINELHDWFNKHHFDYRGLISMGLSLEAPDDMY
jgi:hypothetical protein